jgi:hypothetical protein
MSFCFLLKERSFLLVSSFKILCNVTRDVQFLDDVAAGRSHLITILITVARFEFDEQTREIVRIDVKK